MSDDLRPAANQISIAPMPKHSLFILELAKKGAAHRYQELKAELADLLKAFHHLEFGSAVSPNVPPQRAPRRKRSKLSPAGRRAIAAAQRARWAKVKAAKAAGSGKKKRRGMSAAARSAVSARMKAYWAKRKRVAK